MGICFFYFVFFGSGVPAWGRWEAGESGRLAPQNQKYENLKKTKIPPGSPNGISWEAGKAGRLGGWGDWGGSEAGEAGAGRAAEAGAVAPKLKN